MSAQSEPEIKSQNSTEPSPSGETAPASAPMGGSKSVPASEPEPTGRGPASWTLRARLLIFVTALMIGSSVIIGGGSVVAVNRFLGERLDKDLQTAVNAAVPFIAAARREQHPTDGDGDTPAPTVGTGINTPGLGFRTLVLHDGLGGVMGEDGRTITLSAAQRKILASVPTDSRPRDIELGDGLDHYRVVAILAPNNETWITGLPLDGVEATVRKLAIGVLLVTLLVLGATILIGSAVIRVTLRPLNRVTATALRVSELPLSSGNAGIAERVPEADTDPNTEVGQVGTALNRLLDHIAAALAARQASENRVRRFVSDASHELRTPLASIRGYAELARRTREPVPGDVAHALSRVQSEADRMTALVEDLLMLARLDERRAMEREEVDLTTTVIDAVSDAHAAGPGHNWQLELPDEPVLVRGDQHRLHQVIANLLANARAHTPPGTKVTTAVTWEAALNQAVLTVSDTGPGIPAELQGEVFDRFARGDSSRNRAGGASTGLGLAIVSSVVAAHGGTVAVTSRPGETVFTVRLPGMG